MTLYTVLARHRLSTRWILAAAVPAALILSGPAPAQTNSPPTNTHDPCDIRMIAGKMPSHGDLGELFFDPDGDSLAYSVTNSLPEILEVAIRGSMLVVQALSEGESRLILTAADPHGASASATMSVQVSPESDDPLSFFGDVHVYGDFNGDLVVDFDDFFSFADHFGLTTEDPRWDPVYDMVPDSVIDFDDFYILADNWGRRSREPEDHAFALDWCM